MKVSDLFRSAPAHGGKLRQEIFALGDRHRGDALGGALKELQGELTPERRSLLRAVVNHLSPGQSVEGEPEAASAAPRAGLRAADLFYLAVIAGAATWIMSVARGL